MATAFVIPNELTTYDLPGVTLSGTARRRVLISFKATTTEGGGTANLIDWVKNINDIEGIYYQTVGSGAASGTTNTWTGTSQITLHGTAGDWEMGIVISII